MSKCYILTIITNMFQKQCQDLVTTQDMMLHLKEMFGEQCRSARQAHVHQNGGVNSSQGTCLEDDFSHQQTRYAWCTIGW